MSKPIEAADLSKTINLYPYAGCDGFICEKCGIHLKGWGKFEPDEEEPNNEELYDYYEFEFGYCPNCGAEVREE